VPALRLWYSMNGWDQELIIPGEVVDSLMLPAVEHEIGHIIAAAHFQAVLFGIGVGFLPERGKDGIYFQAVYGWENCPLENQCVVAAAGPAADLLYRGAVDERAAIGDLADIERMTGVRALEPHLTAAKEILSRYPDEIAWASDMLRKELRSDVERNFIRLPNEKNLSRCLSLRSSSEPALSEERLVPEHLLSGFHQRQPIQLDQVPWTFARRPKAFAGRSEPSVDGGRRTGSFIKESRSFLYQFCTAEPREVDF
jgi:hypothetical protein